MPLPEAAEVTRRFARRANALEAGVGRQLIDAYAPIWLRLRSDVISLVNEAQDRQLSEAQLIRVNRYRSLMEQIDRDVARYATTAGRVITAGQATETNLAAQAARRIVEAGLPSGLDLPTLNAIGLGWNELPADAVIRFVGIAGDGQPLGRLLEPLGAIARERVTRGITEGIALGLGPRQVAANIRDHFGMPLTRSLLISRTEMLRAYRESSRAQYEANSQLVRGYQRSSAQDERVCMACIALDGTFYETLEPLNEHPGGRCAMLPVTLSYADLGLNVPEPQIDLPSARDWFARQSAEVQRRMMGRSKFEAWQSGQFELTDMARIKTSPIWGDAAVEATLKELV